MDKTFCPIDALDIKFFNLEQQEKLAEYYCDLINCSVKSGTFPEYENFACVRSILEKDSDPVISTPTGSYIIHRF